jgi:hypothetical protein
VTAARYEVESIGVSDTGAGESLESTIQRRLNQRLEEGWEFVESHRSPQDPTVRIFIFKLPALR